MTDTAAEQARELYWKLRNYTAEGCISEIAAALRAAEAGAIERAAEMVWHWEGNRADLVAAIRALASPSAMRSAESAHHQQPTEGGPESRTTENLGRPSTSHSAMAMQREMTPLTAEMITAGIAALGSDDDRLFGELVSDVYRAMERARLDTGAAAVLPPKTMQAWFNDGDMPPPDSEPHLPCDVRIGATLFRKGAHLSTLVSAAQRWHEIAAKTYDTTADLPSPPASEGTKL